MIIIHLNPKRLVIFQDKWVLFFQFTATTKIELKIATIRETPTKRSTRPSGFHVSTLLPGRADLPNKTVRILQLPHATTATRALTFHHLSIRNCPSTHGLGYCPFHIFRLQTQNDTVSPSLHSDTRNQTKPPFNNLKKTQTKK